MGGKRRRARPASATPEEPGAGLGGLAAALASQGFEASGDEETDRSASGPTSSARSSGKAVVRRERKGRGGKTVTVIDGSWVAGADLPVVVKAMRKALGTGARVEDGRIVLQGDQRTAAASWLEQRGAKVVLGN